MSYSCKADFCGVDIMPHIKCLSTEDEQYKVVKKTKWTKTNKNTHDGAQTSGNLTNVQANNGFGDISSARDRDLCLNSFASCLQIWISLLYTALSFHIQPADEYNCLIQPVRDPANGAQ